MTVSANDLARFVMSHLHGDDAGKPVPLGRLADCSLLWADPSLARRNWAGRGCDADTDFVEEYGWYRNNRETQRSAIADRYGGFGIGVHGGSGRAAFLGGAHVKGIGPTNLLGRTDDGHHASGKAYLEEAVRETIFSQIIEAEFPHGAVPTIAILHTGLVRDEEPGEHVGPCPVEEPQVLMVRPGIVRPAHFERAPGFNRAPGQEGEPDVHRVRAAFERTFEDGTSWLPAQFRLFAERWAEQLAYGFVHRLHHLGASSANMDLSGALLDFGATSSVPTWADFTMGVGLPSTCSALSQMASAIETLLADFEATVGRPLVEFDDIDRLWRRVELAYERCLVIETLRICGLLRQDAEAAIGDAKAYAAARRALQLALRHYGSDSTDIIFGVPEGLKPWEFAKLYEDDVPAHLRALRRFVDQASTTDGRSAIVGRNRFRSRGRPGLHREDLRRALYLSLMKARIAQAYSPDSIARIIEENVARNRRDSRVELPGYAMIGSAIGHEISGTVHCRPEDGKRMLVVEDRHADLATDLTIGEAYKVAVADNESLKIIGSRTELALSARTFLHRCVHEPLATCDACEH